MVKIFFPILYHQCVFRKLTGSFSMRLHIEHITTFTYTHLISEAYTEMRLKPNEAGGQRCLSFTLATEPRGDVKA